MCITVVKDEPERGDGCQGDSLDPSYLDCLNFFKARRLYAWLWRRSSLSSLKRLLRECDPRMIKVGVYSSTSLSFADGVSYGSYQLQTIAGDCRLTGMTTRLLLVPCSDRKIHHHFIDASSSSLGICPTLTTLTTIRSGRLCEAMSADRSETRRTHRGERVLGRHRCPYGTGACRHKRATSGL